MPDSVKKGKRKTSRRIVKAVREGQKEKENEGG